METSHLCRISFLAHIFFHLSHSLHLLEHRQNGIGLGSMCARMGGVLAPMLHFLRGVSPLAPMVLCGLCPLLGSALTLMLPETANKHLPDTVEDVEGPDLRCGSALFSPFTNLTLGSATNTFCCCHWLKVVAESFVCVLQWGRRRCEAPPSGNLTVAGGRGQYCRLMMMMDKRWRGWQCEPQEDLFSSQDFSKSKHLCFQWKSISRLCVFCFSCCHFIVLVFARHWNLRSHVRSSPQDTSRSQLWGALYVSICKKFVRGSHFFFTG